MSFPKTYYKEYINGSCKRIGQENTGLIKYEFNKQGFRCDIDYKKQEENAICFFGSALTTGVGHQWQDAYPKKSLQDSNLKAYNFAQGCLPVDNNNILEHVEFVKNMENFKPLCYVIQFIGLERVFDKKTLARTVSSDKDKNVKIFVDVFKKLEVLLQNDKWMFFGCDAGNHDIPKEITQHEKCIIWNPRFIDSILMDLPGPKWHHMMSLGVRKKLEKLYQIK